MNEIEKVRRDIELFEASLGEARAKRERILAERRFHENRDHVYDYIGLNQRLNHTLDDIEWYGAAIERLKAKLRRLEGRELP